MGPSTYDVSGNNDEVTVTYGTMNDRDTDVETHENKIGNVEGREVKKSCLPDVHWNWKKVGAVALAVLGVMVFAGGIAACALGGHFIVGGALIISALAMILGAAYIYTRKGKTEPAEDPQIKQIQEQIKTTKRANELISKIGNNMLNKDEKEELELYLKKEIELNGKKINEMTQLLGDLQQSKNTDTDESIDRKNNDE